MSDVSKHGAHLVHEKFEACNTGDNEETPEDEIYYLTEEVPIFDMVLTKSHVKYPCGLKIPKFALPMLPSTEVPVILRHGGKNWTVHYNGGTSRPRFDRKWKDFVIDNKLKAGDACVFEVIDPSPENTTLKVFILRGDLPPELEALMDTRGGTSESPIVLE